MTPPPGAQTQSVDVVLCTHNGARFLEAQLRSLVSQTARIDRVIVSDDASTDDTLRIVESFARELPVEISRNAVALGAVRNFQHALRSARGGLVFLCDQDDVWHADKVARTVAIAQGDEHALLFHSDARIVDDDERPTGSTLASEVAWPEVGQDASGNDDFVSLLRRNFVTGATMAIRRELIGVSLPVPEGFWHDEWLALMAASLGSIRRIDETLIDYRIHANNQAGLRGVQRDTRLRAMASPRGDYHVERARKAAVLCDRMHMLLDRVRSDRVQLAAAAREHWERRSTLASARVRRVPAVAGELLSGRYQRYSSGLRSAIRDLLETLH